MNADEIVEQIKRLHFRNGQARCSECGSIYPCRTIQATMPPLPSIWEQLKGVPGTALAPPERLA